MIYAGTKHLYILIINISMYHYYSLRHADRLSIILYNLYALNNYSLLSPFSLANMSTHEADHILAPLVTSCDFFSFFVFCSLQLNDEMMNDVKKTVDGRLGTVPKLRNYTRLS